MPHAVRCALTAADGGSTYRDVLLLRTRDTSMSDEQKQELKRRWMELNGSEQSFERWVGHHDVSFRTALTFTEDGHTFSPPQPLFDPSWRVWRPHTFGSHHYVIGLRCHGQSWQISPELECMIR